MFIIIEIIILILEIIYQFLKLLTKCICRKRKQVSGQVVLITGSAHGIGRELAFLFQERGARLALVDINQKLNEKLVQELKNRSKFCEAISYRCDLTDSSDIEETVGQILLDFGQVDILINNAGVANCVPFFELTKEKIKQTFDVNVLAQFWFIKQLLPMMIERKRGHIVAISSVCGLATNKNLVDYCSSKFAVVGMMDALHKDLTESKHDDYIKLTTVCPMGVSTGMFKNLRSRFEWLYPIMTPETTAAAIVDRIEREVELVTTIPKYVYWIIAIVNILPIQVQNLLYKFISYETDRN